MVAVARGSAASGTPSNNLGECSGVYCLRSRPQQEAVTLISIVFPVYNGGRFLATAIQSLLAQTFTDFEIIAVNDGSTDDSERILDRAAATDPRIRVLSRPNTGIVGALNDGIAMARGDLISRMDADDISLPQRLEKQVAYLADHSECVAVGTDVLYTDPEGAPLVRHYPAEDHDGIVEQLLNGNGGALIHPTITVRRRLLEEVGGYRARYQWIEDFDLYLRLSEKGRLANLPEVHLHYRQHLGSVNKVCANRDGVCLELVNARRGVLGLTPLARVFTGPQPDCAADWRRHWAFDAARGGNWASARKNAKKALFAAPLDLRNWRCLKYMFLSSPDASGRPVNA
jgi:glycosyltransferase involved in cell wall biosynthesis